MTNQSSRRYKLKTFNDLYYNDKANITENIKFQKLPNWMKSYGYHLTRELNNSLPNYYRVFKRGTVVMTDFGVRIGSEMSFNHFAVVLSNNDDQYKPTVIAVPLSSKYKKGYVSLGKEIFNQAFIHFTNQINKLKGEIIQLRSGINALDDEFKNNSHFNFSEPEEINFIKRILKQSENSEDISEDISIEINEISSNSDTLSKLIQKFESDFELDDYPNVKHMVIILRGIQSKGQHLSNEVSLLNTEIDKLEDLKKQLEKFNKKTYADVENITTISKLRASKFSKYNISENIIFSEQTLNKLITALNRRIC